MRIGKFVILNANWGFDEALKFRAALAEQGLPVPDKATLGMFAAHLRAEGREMTANKEARSRAEGYMAQAKGLRSDADAQLAYAKTKVQSSKEFYDSIIKWVNSVIEAIKARAERVAKFYQDYADTKVKALHSQADEFGKAAEHATSIADMF